MTDTSVIAAKPLDTRAIQPKRTSRRWVLGLVVVGAVFGPFLPAAYHVVLGSNFHTVAPGRCYRAAQPSAHSLETLVREYGIQSVINLRGPNPGEDWYDEELESAQRLKLRIASVNMSASFQPLERSLKQLVDTLDQFPEPILIHCNSGSDRSGLAGACFLLLKTNSTLDQARSQLSLRYGHVFWGMAASQDRVVDQYQAWLETQGLVHQPDHFRHWAREVYIKDD